MSIDKALVALATDLSEAKERLTSVEATQEHHSAMFEQLLKSQAELVKMMNQVQVSTTSLASSVGLAMSELSLARGLERRIERLEAAVFPPKH